MISKINYCGTNDIFISYEKDGYRKEIKINDITPIWNELSEDTFESGKAYLWNQYIAFSALVASDQGGVFFVWDTETEKFIHYSECSYFADAVYNNETIIVLREISNYVTPFHLEVYVVPFGTTDIEDWGQRVFCEQPMEYNAPSPDEIQLRLAGNILEIVAGDDIYRYSSDVSQLLKQEPNEKFADLYIDYGHGMNPNKLKLRSMIT